MLSSILASPLLPRFLDTYELPMSSLECEASWTVINWSICLSSFLSILRMVPSISCDNCSTVCSFDEISAAELCFKKSSHSLFLNFISSLLVWWYSLPLFQSTCNFPFLLAFWFFLDLAILFFLLFFFFLFSLWTWYIFLCWFLSYIYIYIYIYICIFLLFVLKSPIPFLFFQQFDVIHLRQVINLSFFLIL